MSLAFKKNDFLEFKDDSGNDLSGTVFSIMYQSLSLVVTVSPFLDCEIDFKSVRKVNGNTVIII